MTSYLPYSDENLLIRNEDEFHLRNIEQAVKTARNDIEVYRDYKCGSHTVGLLQVWESSCYYAEEDINEVTRSYTIIDFVDHSVNMEKRDREISKFLYDYTRAQGKVPNISILHIHKDEIGELYAFALPCLTGIETSMSYVKMRSSMDYRCVYSEEAGMDTIDMFHLAEPNELSYK